MQLFLWETCYLYVYQVTLEYVWDNMNLSKVGDCLVIAGTKSIIVAATWPLVTLRVLKDLIYDTYNVGNMLHLGYFKSPYYLVHVK